jgi:hypothetical protein
MLLHPGPRKLIGRIMRADRMTASLMASCRKGRIVKLAAGGEEWFVAQLYLLVEAVGVMICPSTLGHPRWNLSIR